MIKDGYNLTSLEKHGNNNVYTIQQLFKVVVTQDIIDHAIRLSPVRVNDAIIALCEQSVRDRFNIIPLDLVINEVDLTSADKYVTFEKWY